MSKSTDIVICAMPYIETEDALMAPAVLKTIAESCGYTASTLDLNIEVMRKLEHYPNLAKITNFFHEEYVDSSTIDDISGIIDYATQRILSVNPKIVGLSLLAYTCQSFTKWLCAQLKSLRPDIKIIIGGPGTKQFLVDTNNQFCDMLLEQKLIDSYIVGDAENSFKEYLHGNIDYPGINMPEWKPLDNLIDVPLPNYDDYIWTLYKNPSIGVLESKGCVRTCEFCDIIEHWKKYQYRSAEALYNESMHQIKKYNLNHIAFKSSLVNGNMKEFKKLIKLFSDYNDTNPDNPVSWSGYFIIRSDKEHPEDLWQLIASSNGHLEIGIESVVRRIRWQIGKKFENEDIDYHLKMIKKYKIGAVLFNIIGYPTETLEEYEFTKNWFRERVEYAPYIDIVGLFLSAILPNTKLDRKSDEYNLIKGKMPSVWYATDGSITTSEKLRRRVELQKLCTDLGWKVWTGDVRTIETTGNHAEG